MKDQHALKNETTQTMAQQILSLLNEGIHLSELEGLTYGLGTSFRTRVSDLRKQGHKIKDYFVTTHSGRRYKRYYLEVEK